MRTNRALRSRLLLAVLAMALLGPALVGFLIQTAEESALSRFDFAADHAGRWRLPDRLREVSGLAMTPDGRLLAHDDERGIVFEIDYENERMVKAFALGNPTVRADFEGIAVVQDTVYLVSSNGWLYQAREGEAEERVSYTVYRLGLDGRCEAEGLAVDLEKRSLLIVCKTVDGDDLKGSLAIFSWSIDRREFVSDSPVLIDRSTITSQIPGKSFNPSGIELHPELGTYFVIAARQEAVAEVNLNGDVLAVARLQGDRHRQVEGIAFTPQGDLILGDEGGNRGGRLTLYQPSSR